MFWTGGFGFFEQKSTLGNDETQGSLFIRKGEKETEEDQMFP